LTRWALISINAGPIGHGGMRRPCLKRKRMRAKDVMSLEVVTIDAKATLLEAVTLLINSHESALPVLDDHASLVGIVSEFDLIRHVMGSDAGKLATFQSQLEKGGDLDDAYAHALKARVTTIMTTAVITAQEDSELSVIADLILAHQVQRVPILRGKSMVGIVRRGDLMKALLSRSGASAATPLGAGQVADDQLRQAVMGAIRKAGVPVGGGFDVVAHSGVVHLWGEVHDEEHHRLCRAAAANVPGVMDISSHMQTLPGRPTGLRWR
jgi:CBS domain-containing protein